MNIEGLKSYIKFNIKTDLDVCVYVCCLNIALILINVSDGCLTFNVMFI